MQYQFSLAHLTALEYQPHELVYLAARTGYDFVSLRLIPMGIPGESSYILEDKDATQKTKIALNETGIRVLDIELARILKDKAPKDYVPFLETAAELGARHVITSAWSDDLMQRSFIADRYGELCDLAKPYGLTVDVEFPTFSQLTNLEEALDIVNTANRENSGILIDTLYFYFSKVSLEELKALPTKWVHFLHICDTSEQVPKTKEEMKHIARENRLYLGEGSIDFKPIFEHIPIVPLSIELPNAQRVEELGYEGHAKRCLETAQEHFSRFSLETQGES